jgi:hypothetical protein
VGVPVEPDDAPHAVSAVRATIAATDSVAARDARATRGDKAMTFPPVERSREPYQAQITRFVI